ncbi:hypothetical protein, partial [Escherichia coli]
MFASSFIVQHASIIMS